MARRKHNPNQLSFLAWLDAQATQTNGHHNGHGTGNGHANGGVTGGQADLPVVDVDIDRLDRVQGISAICGRYYRMSREEEGDLVAKAQGGCLRSRDRLICHNLGFILSTLTKQYPGRDGLEMLGAGCLGMAEAIDRFDAGRNLRLISYAVHWVRSRARADEEHEATIRQPRNWAGDRARIHAEMTITGRDYLTAAEAVGIKKDHALRMQATGTSSLDAPVSTGENARTLEELLADDTPSPLDDTITANIKAEIRQCVWALPQREREVVTRLFGLNGQGEETLQEIGDDWGLSRERVRQIKVKAVEKLTRWLAKRGMNKAVLEAF